MLKIKFKLICFLLAFYWIGNIFTAASFNFGSRSSAIKVGEDAELSLRDYNLDFRNGTLSFEHRSETPNLPVRVDRATRSISFRQSYLEIDGPPFHVYNTFVDEAVYKPATQSVVLDGNGSLRSEYGKFLLNLEPHMFGNLIAGQPTFLRDITLRDAAATLTIAIQSKLNKNIVLNGGEIFLRDDLKLADDVQLTGGGTVRLNRRRISLGGKELSWNGDIEWQDAGDIVLNNNMTLNSTWTFNGNNVLQGNGHVLTLGSNGKIIVERDYSSVLFHDIKIDGISGNKIRCFDHTGTVSFSDLTWVQDGNYSFSEGRFAVVGTTKMQGDYVFAYETDLVSTIFDNSRLIWDSGFTFSYAPQGTTNRQLLQMADATAEIMMNGAILHSTTTGLMLTKGTLLIDHKNYIYDEFSLNRPATALSEAVAFGDGVHDLNIEVLPGGNVELMSGIITYNNAD